MFHDTRFVRYIFCLIIGLFFAVPAFTCSAMAYTMQDGSQVNVDDQVVSVMAKSREKAEGVTTLSEEEMDAVISQVASMSDAELAEINEAIAKGLSFKNLTADEVQAVNKAYAEVTNGTVSDDSDKESSTSPLAAAAGAAAGVGAVGYGFSTVSNGSSSRRGFSIFTPKEPAKTDDKKDDGKNSSDDNDSPSAGSNVNVDALSDVTYEDVCSGYDYISLDCDDWDDESESTKEFACAVAGVWNKRHPELGPLLITSGKRDGGGGSHHDYGEAFDVANDYFDDSSLRDEYCSIVSELGGTPLDEWSGMPGAVWAHGDNIHATTPNADWGNGGEFSISNLFN